MENQVLGKKISNTFVFTIDGQPLDEQKPKPLKVLTLQQPQITKKNSSIQNIAPKKVKQESKQIKETTKKKNSSIKQPQATVVLQQKKENLNYKDRKDSSEEKINEVINQPPVQMLTEIRQPRQFKALSEQFPNLMKSLSQPTDYQIKQYHEDSSMEDEESEEDDDEVKKKPESENQLSEHDDMKIVDQDESLFPKLPEPQVHPKNKEFVQERVEKIVKENNKKYIMSKEEQRKQRELEKQKLRDQRQLMKDYGKNQIKRTHNFKDPFEQKHPWGKNQNKEKELEEKRKKLQVEKDSIKPLKEIQKEKSKQLTEQIAELFPESKGRVSRYKKIWLDEAIRSVSRKKKDEKNDRSTDRGCFSDPEKETSPECKKKLARRDEVNKDDVFKKIEENAKKLLEQKKLQKLKVKQDILMKKHRIDYIDREAKQILSKTKKVSYSKYFTNIKVAFIPNKSFDNKISEPNTFQQSQSQQQFQTILEHPQEENPPQEENKQNQQQTFTFFNVDHKYILTEQEYLDYFQKKIKNSGKVLTKYDYEQIRKLSQKNKQLIEQLKKKLDHSFIKIKRPDPLTRKEVKIKEIMDKQIDIAKIVEKERQKSQTKEKPKKNADLGALIFQDAEIPDVNRKYVNDDGLDDELPFRVQIENMIKEKMLMKKMGKSRSPNQRTHKNKKDDRSEVAQLRDIYELIPLNQPPKDLRKNAIKTKEFNQQRIKKVFKSEEPKEYQEPRYPLYHDLGETDMFQDDVYNIEHQGDFDQFWKESQYRQPFQNESDHDDETQFLQKSGFYRDQEKPIATQTSNFREIKPRLPEDLRRGRNKTVTFKDAAITDDSHNSQKIIENINNSKSNLEQLIKKQKQDHMMFSNDMKGKYTTDDDSDETYLLNYSKQMWHVSDPLNKDLFLMSANELMNMPFINV